jgi:hypothetical protein
MKMRDIFALWLFVLINTLFLYGQQGIVVATASDSQYYKYLINFIGGLHRVDFKNLHEIMVFDLGLSKKDRDQLSRN